MPLSFTTHFDNQISNPDKLFVFIHGFNANGRDLLSLSRYFSQDIENCLFLAPDAPYINVLMDNSYYWYHVDSLKADYLAIQLDKIMPRFIEYINELKAKYNVKNKDIYLCGFSQGALLTLHYGLTQTDSFAGLISHSGGLIPEILKNHKLNKSKTCIVHGKLDPIIPYEYSQQARDFLNNHKITNELHIIDELSHSFNPYSISAIKAFLQNNNEY